MTRDDLPKFKAMIASVYELYRQGKNLSQATMTLWFKALEGYDIGIIGAALSRHSRNPDNGQFLPLPADVIKLIEGASDDVALQAWNKVDRAIRCVGPYQDVVFDDAMIHYTVAELGGWTKLGAFTEDDWKYQRQAFVTLYRGARQRDPTYPRVLHGIASSENSGKYAGRRTPVLVGDRARCLNVMQGGTDAPLITMRPLAEHLMAALPKREAA